MCAAKSTVYRFWKLETSVLENHSFPEKILSTTLVKNPTEVGEGVRMAREEREGSVVSSQNTSRGYVPYQQARDVFQKGAR